MRSIPWYMNVSRQCEVLNRIANRISYSSKVSDMADVMDHCTMLLWSKVDRYYFNSKF